jgi:predicted RNA-binding Zn ribbon-like protein
MSSEPSPAVRLVRDFVNTAEPQLGTDQLVSPTATECLYQLGIVPDGARVAAADLPLLVGIREGLREMLLEHAGHDVRESVLRELDVLLRSVPMTIRLTGATARLSPVDGRAAHGAAAEILSAVVAAPPEEWARLKVCARDSCRWAFFDFSRNRSGRWCSMDGCGNIVKMRRAYRTRKASASGVESPS